MSNGLDTVSLLKAIASPRWTALVRLDLDALALAHWDSKLLRETRVLVPIDVQALYVPPDDEERYVRLPFVLTTPDGDPPASMPAPFEEGARRLAGVHLHWAPPDALLRGDLGTVAGGTSNRLGLPTLADRWIVVRLSVPTAADKPHVKAWVVTAETAKAVPLEQWPDGVASAPAAGKSLSKAELNGTVGGSVAWSAVYDASVNRFAFHDPLDDLATVAPNAVVGDLAAYVVAGWWSDPQLDPLDGAETTQSLHDRLRELGWSLIEDSGAGDQIRSRRAAEAVRRATLGVPTGRRYVPAIEVPRAPTDVSGGLGSHSFNAAFDYRVSSAAFADEVAAVTATEPKWPRSTLLHGVVHGVPVAGSVVADQRPSADDVDLVVGRHGDDVAATLAAAGLGVDDPGERRSLERLLAAFSGQLLTQVSTPDGLVTVEEHEHSAGFSARPGGDGAVERLKLGGQAGPLTAGRAARSRAARQGATKGVTETKITWAGARADLRRAKLGDLRAELTGWMEPPDDGQTVEVREVRRPAPRFFLPIEPLVAVRGAKRSLRHHGDGRFSPDGLLRCRWPSQVPTAIAGVADGAELIPALGTGAIPDEVIALVRSALIQDPYLVRWLSDAAAARRQLDRAAVRSRLSAETALRFGRNGIFDGGTGAFAADRGSWLTRRLVADELRRFSLVAGVDPDPVAVTAWSQPWVPLWLEWEVALLASDRLEGWRLGPVDFEADREVEATSRSISGRSPISAGTARTVAAAIEEWLVAEQQRDRDNAGEADNATAAALDRITGAISFLDVVSASLDGIQPALLGLPFGDYGALRERDGAELRKPIPVDVPQLLVSGALRLNRARLVDAFGRTLELPVDGVRVPARDEIPNTPPALRIGPRLTRPARWLFRFLDPTDTAEAKVDQVDPTAAVNPVAGFILPDHMDEALELFDTGGEAVGQLFHEPFGGGVAWEIAPGREGPVDAGPLHGLGPRQQALGHLASGLVAADARTRDAAVADPAKESALSALLRAIDTTLWTVDTFAVLGNEHVAGLVGRPIAVVRASLRLDVDDDLDELDLSDDERREARESAYNALADRAFPVRIGELTRSDDGLLGFFVNDDYTRVRVVDRAVRDSAFESGRGRGQLGRLGTTPQIPDSRPIEHPYVIAEDEFYVHFGQTVHLTLLMHPGGKVHLTSGILPRKALQLVRDWVKPGLTVMAPSLRAGPVLLDPGDVRMPKVSSFPKDQLWTRRTSPYTWRDDPILAATQAALLPDSPAEVQEGYIRVAPARPEEQPR